jgi:ribosomal protein S18 acetylase RimI-like enzyme
MITEPQTWLQLREAPRASDVVDVGRIIESTGFFSVAEVDIARELVEERLNRGLASGYRFVFADPTEDPARLAGYTCYGEIPCTVGSYDLYWIAVDDELRGRRIGAWLLAETERRIRELGGRRVYIETSGRDLYAPTQGFYTRCGYALEARLEEFYGEQDPKLIYVKQL